MNVVPTRLPEVLLIEPRYFTDERGFFMESWNQQAFDNAIGESVRFVQDNHSRSKPGVLRGLHYQLAQPQGKLVRAVRGRIFNVAVDMRRSSPRLAQWVGVELSASNLRQLWVPPGFAHGFLALSGPADVLYKASGYYLPSDECSLAWNDPHVAVEWPLHEIGGHPVLSLKDQLAPRWDSAALY